MDEIARLAHSMGAVAIVDGKEVWATASGGVVRKLMLAARDAALADVIDICSRKPHLRAGDIEAEVDDMRSNAELSGPRPLAAEGSRSNDVLGTEE